MKRIVLILFFIIALSLPQLSFAAGFIPCGGAGEEPCQACHLVTLGQTILEFVIGIMIGIIGLVFIFGGMKMVMSAGNTESVSTAKHMMTNAIIGFVILLAAWIVVDTVLKTFTSGSQFGTWNEIKCVTQPPTTPSDGGGVVVPPTSTTTPSTGSCTIPSFGACSVSSLQDTFGSIASEAAQICMAESGGNAASLSQTDRLTGTREPFSVGLFQINLTVHSLDGCGFGGKTLECHTAFQGKNYSAVIVNRPLYNQCVIAAQNATCNMKNARKIYNQKNSWSPWSTAKICHLN